MFDDEIRQYNEQWEDTLHSVNPAWVCYLRQHQNCVWNQNELEQNLLICR